MISWFIATNHCAFGLMKQPVETTGLHSHCCSGGPTPAKDAPADEMQQCCKSIHATLAPEQAAVKFDSSKFELRLFILVQLLMPGTPQRDLGSFEFDHRPPQVVSFAESVLQRSLLSHAPPFAV
jgi:hypothetical protein